MKKNERGQEHRNEVRRDLAPDRPALGDMCVVASCVPANLRSARRAEGKHDNAWRTILVVAFRIFGEQLPPWRGTLRLGRSVYYLR